MFAASEIDLRNFILICVTFQALELKNKNKSALVARSQCHLKLGDAAAALKDAEASFDSEDTYIQGLYQFAEALFNLGQFEQALIAFHRGFRARRDKEEFRVGINKAQDAIRRAIGGTVISI